MFLEATSRHHKLTMSCPQDYNLHISTEASFCPGMCLSNEDKKIYLLVFVVVM